MHLELNAHFLGNPPPEFDVDTHWLTINLVGIRREILIDTDLQVAGIQDDVVGALRRPVEQFVPVVNLLGQDHLGEQQQGKYSK